LSHGKRAARVLSHRKRAARVLLRVTLEVVMHRWRVQMLYDSLSLSLSLSHTHTHTHTHSLPLALPPASFPLSPPSLAFFLRSFLPASLSPSLPLSRPPSLSPLSPLSPLLLSRSPSLSQGDDTAVKLEYGPVDPTTGIREKVPLQERRRRREI